MRRHAVLALLLSSALPSCTAFLWDSALSRPMRWETQAHESGFVTTEIRARVGENPPQQFWLRLRAEDDTKAAEAQWLALAPERVGDALPHDLIALLGDAETGIENAVLRSTDVGDGQVWFPAEASFERGRAAEAADGAVTAAGLSSTVPLLVSWVRGPPDDSEVVWQFAPGQPRTPVRVRHTSRRLTPDDEPEGYKVALATLATPFTLALDAAGVGAIIAFFVWASRDDDRVRHN